MLFQAGIVRHRLSANQIVRFFKLKKLENCTWYQIDFWLPQITAGFYTIDFFALFDLLILMLGIPLLHCTYLLSKRQSEQ